MDDQLEDTSVKNTEINEEWKESIILGARKELITATWTDERLSSI